MSEIRVKYFDAHTGDAEFLHYSNSSASSVVVPAVTFRPPTVPRFQLIELHDQNWFPDSLRVIVTDALQFGVEKLGLYSASIPMIRRLCAVTQQSRVVDLGSGAGGPWTQLSASLDETSVCLTDIYPNLKAFVRANVESHGRISFCREKVDARSVPGDLLGIRTMFSSFHHFPPSHALAILQDAVDAGEPIAIFESTRRSFLSVIAMFCWAVLQLAFAPFIAPFEWTRLFWTYVIPVVPLVLLFDGIVSCFRTYSPAEMFEMTQRLTGPAYHWEAGVKSSGVFSMPITFLIGYPRTLQSFA